MLEALLILNVFLGIIAVYQRAITIEYLMKEKEKEDAKR